MMKFSLKLHKYVSTLGLDGFCIKKKKSKRFYVKIEIFFKDNINNICVL